MISLRGGWFGIHLSPRHLLCCHQIWTIGYYLYNSSNLFGWLSRFWNDSGERLVIYAVFVGGDPREKGLV